MYTQRLSKTIDKYYVYGIIDQESMITASNPKDFYVIVILDRENLTFAIEPYDGSMFK